MGRIIARDMKQARVVEPVIADRDLGPARGLGVALVQVNVFDPDSLARALAGAACVIASLPYRMNLLAMDAALAARAHYIDLGGLYHMTLRQLERHGAFRDAGLMAILGMGSAPGIVNVMAAHAAEGMTRVDEVHCMVAAHDGTRWETPPLLPFGYSPDTLLDEFALPSAVFRDGAIRMVPPLASAERRREPFPGPVGEIELDTTLHSEVATLPDFFRERGVREVTFRQGFEATFADRLRLLVHLGLADTTPLAALHVAPRDLLRTLLGRLPPSQPIGPVDRHEILRVRVLGSLGDGPREAVTIDCYAGANAGSGIGPDIDTGAPPSIAAQLLGDELLVHPGVFAPEQVIPWAPFRRELERRGMTISAARREVA
jgi:saccharopine dehydrogenase (NAD+, L-lysine-forming)